MNTSPMSTKSTVTSRDNLGRTEASSPSNELIAEVFNPAAWTVSCLPPLVVISSTVIEFSAFRHGSPIFCFQLPCGILNDAFELAFYQSSACWTEGSSQLSVSSSSELA